MVIARHRTAIVRKTLSVPVRLALQYGIITKSRSILDYGCGRGDDLRLLCEQGYNAFGFDPHFAPAAKLSAMGHLDFSADVVMLSYVLNVIEDSIERDDTLRLAWELVKPKGSLVVTVRAGKPLENCTPFFDGQLTRANTFQKLYRADEFARYVADTVAPLKMKVVKVSGGLVAILTRF